MTAALLGACMGAGLFIWAVILFRLAGQWRADRRMNKEGRND